MAGGRCKGEDVPLLRMIWSFFSIYLYECKEYHAVVHRLSRGIGEIPTKRDKAALIGLQEGGPQLAGTASYSDFKTIAIQAVIRN